MLETTEADFFPLEKPFGKPNCKHFFRIGRDGSTTERAFLSVPYPPQRELLICLHYLTHMTRCFLQQAVGVNILSRDEPWDFRLELSTGRIFNLEITAIADTSQHFERNTQEERFTRWIGVDRIPLHELAKLGELFPDPATDQLLADHKARGATMDDLVDNPFRDQGSPLFVGLISEPTETLEHKLRSAITKKAKKPHVGKDETVLVIDNRTSAFDTPDFLSAARALDSFLQSMPFPEIWFYTGYYSDHPPYDAEFDFSVLKVSGEQRDALIRSVVERPRDEKGRVLR